MKVLYILDYGTIGGATHSFLEMVVALKKLGVEPIVCLGKQTDVVEIFKKENIEYFCAGHRTVLDVFNFKGLKWPLGLIKKYLIFWIRECFALIKLKNVDWSNIDIIHTNSARNDIGCFINKKHKIPHVMHIREFADADFNCISFRPDYIKKYNLYTSQFIAISDAVRQHWVNKGLKENMITTIYNGIHYENISISTDESKFSTVLHLFIAGGVASMKGQHLAVEAIGLLPQMIRKNVSLDIAGWGNPKYIKELKIYAETKGFGNLIHFLGSINDVHQQLGNYQIGLMCSRAEGFGRVTAEYMHAQLGVIASDSGANPELIEDGVTGLLFKSGDAKSLAECITRLYNDRDLLVRLSHAAKEKARREYTQQKNAETIYSVYQNILSKK